MILQQYKDFSISRCVNDPYGKSITRYYVYAKYDKFIFYLTTQGAAKYITSDNLLTYECIFEEIDDIETALSIFYRERPHLNIVRTKKELL
jgi:hypothetical protein